MVTSEMLHQCSTKRLLENTLAHATANGWLEEFNLYRRHPSTIVGGVLTVEAADSLFESSNTEMLVHVCGLTHWSDNQAVFITDDSQFGWRVLRELGWFATTFTHRGTAHALFDSWSQMLKHYDEHKRFLSSEQELLDYINRGECYESIRSACPHTSQNMGQLD